MEFSPDSNEKLRGAVKKCADQFIQGSNVYSPSESEDNSEKKEDNISKENRYYHKWSIDDSENDLSDVTD